MNRKICVITGTRADYGLLRRVMQGIKEHPFSRLQIIVTGMHLSPEFGLTHRELEGDNFDIDYKVESLMSSDSEVGVAKSMGLGLIGFSDAFSVLTPDLIVVLGDRFEIFSAVAAALVARIPVAHLHGGETTEGAFDESLRHSITKMSHLHFVAAEEYRHRVIQLGENPNRVYLVGGLGVDNIKGLKLLSRKELENSIEFELGSKNLLVTFHPVTLNSADSLRQLKELLAALEVLTDTNLIFTLPNADTGSRELILEINEFVEHHKNARAYVSLGRLRYLSCVAHVDGVIGNSSSGLTEVPSLNTGTINIGDRQQGRLQADSVITCQADRMEIGAALRRLYTSEFRAILRRTRNPYGEGGASKKIVEILCSHPLDGLVKKKFFDLSAGSSETN